MHNARRHHAQISPPRWDQVLIKMGVGVAALVMLVPISGYALDHYRLRKIQQVWYIESDADGTQQVIYTDGRQTPM